ncbi:hypothetical protein [Paenibacillus sp. GCM10012306]|uniref:hypothetical protein n=1 Tax=Paenibacillus sp. GCM10012306 TaxID=3317342 RepID=UPI00361C3F45
MRELYFSDNFFSKGITPIMDVSGQFAGELDLHSAFSTAISVYGPDKNKLFHGRFPFFSSKWEVSNHEGNVLGRLRSRFSFGSKKYEYDAGARGIYSIVSPMFSKLYTIENNYGRQSATFQQVNGWLQSRAYRLLGSKKKRTKSGITT